jgi:hypothetical protein
MVVRGNYPFMREQQRQRRNYDYNQPVARCKICYTISGWHCYDCDNDFCESHFERHKETDFCAK